MCSCERSRGIICGYHKVHCSCGSYKSADEYLCEACFARITPQETLEVVCRSLIPKVCKRCAEGQELVKDLRRRYAHREIPDGYLQHCCAHGIHNILGTRVEQLQES